MDEKTRKEINTLMNIEGVRHDMSLAREKTISQRLL